MDQRITAAAAGVHGSGRRLVLYLTGGGSLAAAWLLGMPGASRSMLEVRIPYSAGSLQSLLGGPPEHAVSAGTARALALAAFDRAIELGARPETALGIGSTAALRTDRERKGEHRLVAAVESARASGLLDLRLRKGSRSRAEEEEVTARALLQVVARGADRDFGAGGCLELDLDLGAGDDASWADAKQGSPLLRLTVGDSPVVFWTEAGPSEACPEIAFLLPGSFNPPHRGHERLFRAAEGLIGGPGAFEISLANVDKPMLPPGSAGARARVLSRRAPVALTSAPTFSEKASLFPGAAFVVGYDTAVRILTPSYYGRAADGLGAALGGFLSTRTRFFVAGRLAGGVFRTARDLPVPAGFEGLFTEIPERLFREDVSSTEIRALANRTETDGAS